MRCYANNDLSSSIRVMVAAHLIHRTLLEIIIKYDLAFTKEIVDFLETVYSKFIEFKGKSFFL